LFINFRPLLGIRKGYNPVTLGLCIQGFNHCIGIFSENKEFYYNEINKCIAELEKLKSKDYSGTCWGYDFDWESRYARIPAYTPTIVATGFITNALFENYIMTGNKKSIELCKSSVNFLLKDLNKIYYNGDFCYSYSPLDKQVVFNATMKGARLLSQIFSVTNDERLKTEAYNTVSFVAKSQNKDGSWSYSKGDSRVWVDNFHTGYILSCLADYSAYCNDKTFAINLEKGLEFYLNNFIEKDGKPKYYSNKTYPIDATSAAQTIITLNKFGFFDLANKVADWTINHMFDAKGYFYYQKNRLITNKISYTRWSNAWMFLALSYLLNNEKGK
jgi:hypothetical protein